MGHSVVHKDACNTIRGDSGNFVGQERGAEPLEEADVHQEHRDEDTGHHQRELLEPELHTEKEGRTGVQGQDQRHEHMKAGAAAPHQPMRLEPRLSSPASSPLLTPLGRASREKVGGEGRRGGEEERGANKAGRERGRREGVGGSIASGVSAGADAPRSGPPSHYGIQGLTFVLNLRSLLVRLFPILPPTLALWAAPPALPPRPATERHTFRVRPGPRFSVTSSDPSVVAACCLRTWTNADCGQTQLGGHSLHAGRVRG